MWGVGYLIFLPSQPLLQHRHGRDKERRKLQQGGFRGDSRKDARIWNVGRKEDRLEGMEPVNLVGRTWGNVRGKERRLRWPHLLSSSVPTSRRSRLPGPTGGRGGQPAAPGSRVGSGTGAGDAGLEHRGQLRGQLWRQAFKAPSQVTFPR